MIVVGFTCIVFISCFLFSTSEGKQESDVAFLQEEMQSLKKTVEILQKKNDALSTMTMSCLQKHDEVQSLKYTVQSLQRDNNDLTMKTRSFVERLTVLEGQNRELMNHRRLRRLLLRTGAGVAFSARLSHDLSNLGDGQPIVMDYTITNDGGNYSNRTGVFTCSVPGMYVFFANQLTFTGKALESNIVHNGNTVANIYAGDTDHDSSGSNMVVIQLAVGDEVWVRVHDRFHDTGLTVDGPWTTFSGFLLYETE